MVFKMDCELGLEIEWEKRGEKIMIKVEHVKKRIYITKEISRVTWSIERIGFA